MPFGQEIYRSIYGAWRIARFDPGAMRHFNLSLEGFWRSFFASVLLAPFFMLSKIVNEVGDGAEQLAENTAGYIVFWLLIWFLAWAVFPIVMIPVARLLKLSDTYVPFIIAWNWSSVLMAVLLYPLYILHGLSLIGPEPAALFMMAAQVSVFFYGYLVTRASLQSAMFTAIGIVVMEFLLGLLIQGGANQLYYGGVSVPAG